MEVSSFQLPIMIWSSVIGKTLVLKIIRIPKLSKKKCQDMYIIALILNKNLLLNKTVKKNKYLAWQYGNVPVSRTQDANLETPAEFLNQTLL